MKSNSMKENIFMKTYIHVIMDNKGHSTTYIGHSTTLHCASKPSNLEAERKLLNYMNIS